MLYVAIVVVSGFFEGEWNVFVFVLGFVFIRVFVCLFVCFCFCFFFLFFGVL